MSSPSAKPCPMCGSVEPGVRGTYLAAPCPDPFHGPLYTPDRRPTVQKDVVSALTPAVRAVAEQVEKERK